MVVITWCKLIVLSILWGGTFFAVAIALRAWPPLTLVLARVALAVLSTALAYILFFDIMAKAGADNVMLVTLLIPASAIALGVSVLGDRLAAHQIIGALVITASLLVIDGRLFGVKAAANKPSPATKR
jgi:drug/metabolite transporter (DMT)-like permease